MKNYFLIVLAFLLSGQIALANTVVRTGDNVTIAENQSVDGAFYAVGGLVALSGSVNDDVYVIGGNVTVNGKIAKDLAILGGTVSLQGPIEEDLRIIAGDVTISQPVKGNVVVIAGRLTILSTANISGDVLFYGGEGIIDSSVGGKVLGSSDSLRINGEVKGGVDVITKSLTLGDQANISGDVKYTSVNEILRAQNAVVTGKILKNSLITETPVNKSPYNARSIAIFLLISLFTTLSLFLIKRKSVEKFAETAPHRLLLKVVIGFGVIILAPVISLIIMASVLGIVIGLMAFTLFILLVLLSLALMSVYCGVYFAKLLKNKTEINIPLIVIGTLFLQFLLFVPVIGVFVIILILTATLGAIVVQFFNFLRN